MKERVEFGDNLSICRIEEKCTRCGICKNTCNKLHDIGDSCIRCGQCILSCPMGALVPKYDYQKVLNYLNDTDYKVVISIAPSVRVSLIKELNLDSNKALNQLIGILKQLGFDNVYDISLGADITSIEESIEFIERLKNHNLPLITSCCPSWKKFAINNGLDKYISSTKSPMKIQGFLVKHYLSKYFDTSKLINVMLMPCISKKEEICDSSDIDFVITTRELLYLINESNIDLNYNQKSEFDSLLGNASTSGVIFGSSGGVLESIIRTTNYFVNNNDIDITDLNKDTIDLNMFNLKCIKVCGMNEFKSLDISKYDLIEVMACPSGCINGGGQPLVPANEINAYLDYKKQILNGYDKNAVLRYSYKNKDVEDIYKFFAGKPGSKLAKKYFHD